MSGPTVIGFEPPLIDEISFAVAPFDMVTGAIVASGLEARLEGLPDLPVRNRSGLLVFVNLPQQEQYSFTIAAGKAGYLDPGVQTFVMPAANDPQRRAKLRHPLALAPLPSRGFGDGATAIRGVVIDQGKAAPGVEISAAMAPGPARFVTRSGARGDFALPLRLPSASPAEQGEQPVAVAVRLVSPDGAVTRVLNGSLTPGREHAYAAPIALDGANQPQLSPI